MIGYHNQYKDLGVQFHLAEFLQLAKLAMFIASHIFIILF